MNNFINQIYGLTNIALLTPQNLVENIQLDNYLEIKYFTKNNEIVCEMLTEDEDKEKAVYLYYFNMKNQLQRAYAEYRNENIEIFNRGKELECLLAEYDDAMKSSIA
ncbi:hypothetical protein C8E03_105142 [Lachnotalea glycerini]|uniref:Uncharacterized protein n=1 Tax=Lachnotalea glycerini TaxID=1763509 RepID=A0A318ES85_9FIRM|nr:hypothetical protein [Lachnotalea glycerini]OYP41964.1 hypothetical protein CG709_04750 [Lachnotalea glycerini]PXV90234.1 hypothetical protein C8E03_105142 [Lachnotalea glycerini]